ncbi:MAG: efflux RND transporter periplasmic adaptor subunit [Candidatus Solibacter usitatus]|nr:efflux RND transporter periplasmic adaptor subunit [Candidatus Solibacter usitatus]
MPGDLSKLRIDRSTPEQSGSNWAQRWILGGIGIFLLLGAARYALNLANAPLEVEVMRVTAGRAENAAGDIILNATGYIIAAHKIQVASKVIGRVAWIGVEKGDRVKEGQEIVRLEDDEYRAQLQQAKGQLQALEARLSELRNGSRPEEIAVAKANLEVSRADLANAKINLDRVRKLTGDGVLAKQALDDAVARYDSQMARVASLEKTYELVKIGPRVEQVDSVRGQIEEAKGRVAFYETTLSNTVIRAPVTGTILERAVEKGEFLTTSFVGDRGAKGYVVSLANLNDLQVELDINQNDFGKLGPKQKGVITTDAYPDRKYDGFIYEIAPEANRQKATVQVKVRVLQPDEYLRPDMNASVAFVSEAKPRGAEIERPKASILIPASAIRNGSVFAVVGGKAVQRPVETGATLPGGVKVESGLIGGEDLILKPPPELKDGTKVMRKGGS